MSKTVSIRKNDVLNGFPVSSIFIDDLNKKQTYEFILNETIPNYLNLIIRSNSIDLASCWMPEANYIDFGFSFEQPSLDKCFSWFKLDLGNSLTGRQPTMTSEVQHKICSVTFLNHNIYQLSDKTGKDIIVLII